MSKLVIQKGRYYRTRDGRKVGPMIASASKRLMGYGMSPSTHYIETGMVREFGPEHGHDIIAEWAGAPDLTAITTPFGLLDRETQEALKAHGGPWEVFSNDGIWRATEDPSWLPSIAIRAEPAPPKPREWWLCGSIAKDSEEEALAARIEWDRISPGCQMLDLPITHVREVTE